MIFIQWVPLYLINAFDLEKNGPLIMVYTQVMKGNRVNVKLMTPVDKSFVSNKYLNFMTYLYIDQMLHGRLVSDDYSNEEPKLLYEIEEFSRNNNMRRISPYFHIINEIDEMTWVDVKVKVLEVPNT
ncbi:DUF5085 family protein [Staphylococcus epidermidis]|nr:DUF5085 family protein [Staphylococcus epidermidis]MCG2294778.1 DUF5085 family protein [Staphylococcus epidermidis]